MSEGTDTNQLIYAALLVLISRYPGEMVEISAAELEAIQGLFTMEYDLDGGLKLYKSPDTDGPKH